MAESQLKITDKNIDKTEAQLKKYYSKCFKSVVSDFEATYDKLLATVADGKQPTPADLYKLDRYWQLQAQLSNKLTDLGDKQAKLLSKDFENQWKEVYDSIALPSSAAFNSMSDENARQMVNQVWCADGKSWSQRVWNNTDRLKEELNEELIKSVITGKDTRYLKNQLMERFSVSNYRAKTLVKTEMAHIQTQAAAQRYKDYGVEYYEFYADTDERTCSQCGALDKKKFKLSEMKVGVNCPPMHPNDRCCIVPVIDKEKENDIINSKQTRLPINIQLFARKSSDFPTVWLPKDEYAHVMSEISTWVTEEELSKQTFKRFIGNYLYTIENNGFGNFRIIGRRKIK